MSDQQVVRPCSNCGAPVHVFAYALRAYCAAEACQEKKRVAQTAGIRKLAADKVKRKAREGRLRKAGII